MICKTILVLDSGLEFEAVPIQDVSLMIKFAQSRMVEGFAAGPPVSLVNHSTLLFVKRNVSE